MKTHLLASLLLLGSPLLACDSTETCTATVRVVETKTVAHSTHAAPKASVARPVLIFSNRAPAFGKSSSIPITSAPAPRPAAPPASAPARPAPPAARPDHLFM